MFFYQNKLIFREFCETQSHQNTHQNLYIKNGTLKIF